MTADDGSTIDRNQPRGALSRSSVTVPPLRLAFVVWLVACGSGGAVTRSPSADSAVALASGATTTVAAGWSVTRAGDTTVIADPDRGLEARFTAAREPDARHALADAWRARWPDAPLAATEIAIAVPDDGWDQTVTAEREAGARIRRGSARAFRGVAYVVLVDGDRAVLARRRAQLEIAIDGLAAPGLVRESLAGRAPRPLDAARLARLDAFVDDARARLGVPGAAIALVQGRRIVHARGFGVRALGGRDPVTPSTMFLVGSITKSLTTLMQAALVDAGTLAWTTRVTRLLPGFAVGDAALTERLELQHMACACTGMPQQNLETLFEYGDITPEQRVASMRDMKPTTAFGETFQYSNLMVAAGGFAAARAFAPDRTYTDAYAAAMQAMVFEPIGMAETTLDFARVARSDHALPHGAALDGTQRTMPLAVEHMVRPIAPAGGVWTTAADLARYVATELALGIAPGGRRVVSEANVRERRRARIRSGASDGYGLGLSVGAYRGVPVIEHSGGSFGFRTRMVMLPDQQLGVVVLTNTTAVGGELTEVAVRAAVEAWFPGSDALAARQLAHHVAMRPTPGAALAALAMPAAAWVTLYAGRYTNPALGTIELRAEGARAVVDTGEWQSAVGLRQEPDGTTKLILLEPPIAGGPITVGGTPDAPVLVAVDGEHAYTFARTR